MRREKTISTQPKKIREELKISQESWRALVETIPDFILQVDREGKITFINRVVPGFERNQVIGKNVLDFTSKPYHSIVRNAFRQVLKTGKSQSYETEAVGAFGKKASYTSRVAPMKVKGRIEALTVISREITSLKKAEENLQKAHQDLEKRVYERTRQLQKSNENLKREIAQRKEAESVLEEQKRRIELIYKTTREGLTLYDEKGEVVYINPSLRRLFGIKKSIVGVAREKISKSNHDYFSYRMERSDDSLETQRKVYLGQSVNDVTIKIFSRPPRYLAANYVPIKNRERKVLGMIGTFRDITIQKIQADKISRQLEETEQEKDRWQAIFENVEDGVLVLDEKMRILQMNSACERMSGLSEEEAIGKPYYEVFHCHDRVGQYFPDFDPLSKVVQTLEALPYEEHIHLDSEGKERWVGVSYKPILKEEKLWQCVAIIRDITSLKEIEGAKSEFVSIASHELRTPLTVINGYLSLLLNGDLGNISEFASQVHYMQVLDKVYRETRRLTSLVEDLLNVTRIEERRVKLELRKINIATLVEEVISELSPLASGRGISLGYQKDLGEKEILADQGKLKQVLVNLLDNAIKYNQPPTEVKVKIKNYPDYIEIAVDDNGIGIPEKLQKNIFTKFQQVPGSFTKESKGTGLGLFIVKSLVELHKGTIQLKSFPGRGSSFTFTIPTVAS